MENTYIQRPVMVKAYQITMDVEYDAPDWLMEHLDDGSAAIEQKVHGGEVRIYGLIIRTPEGRMKARVGDYIVEEPSGSLRCIKDRHFQALYASTGEIM